MTPTAPTTRTQRERSESTTTALTAAARELFSSRGFAATQLDDVTRAAGVTKGALYHHFSGKVDLFRAVFEREQEHLAAAVSAAYRRERDPWQGFFAGCRAFMEASLDPGVQRITLLDAPSVLGWERMREIQSRYWLRMVEEGVRAAIRAGAIARRAPEPITHLVIGALCEGAMMVARAGDQRKAADRLLAELRNLLASLRTDR